MSEEMKNLEFEIGMTLEVASMFKPTRCALLARIRKTLKKYLANASDALKLEFRDYALSQLILGDRTDKTTWKYIVLEAKNLKLVFPVDLLNM